MVKDIKKLRFPTRNTKARNSINLLITILIMINGLIMSIKLDTFRKENLTQKEKNTKNINLNKKKMNFDITYIYYKLAYVHLIKVTFITYFLCIYTL